MKKGLIKTAVALLRNLVSTAATMLPRVRLQEGGGLISFGASW